MSKMLSIRAARQARYRRQAIFLLFLGVVFLLAAWLLHLNPNTYPVGVLFLGLGMLVAAILNPIRLMIAALLTTALGIAVFLVFAHLIPGGQVLAAYILAIGIALLAIAFVARQGYVRAGAVTPGLIVTLVGIVEYLLAANLTPPNFISFMLSLWLPGFGLLILGIFYFVFSGRE